MVTPINEASPTSAPFGRSGRGGLLLAAAPLGAAIGVFGMIFGAAASTQMDPVMALGMSVFIFSGALQFAALGLAASGAGAGALILTAIALNARHVVLGAVIRPRIEASRRRRAVMAFFMLDESFGLAITSGPRAGFVLLASGAAFFACWLAGTLLGLLGARVVAVEGLAAALFPVLFIGLAAITVRGRRGVLRVAIAATLVVVLSFAVPALAAFTPIIAALAVALPGGRAR